MKTAGQLEYLTRWAVEMREDACYSLAGVCPKRLQGVVGGGGDGALESS